MRKDRIQSLTDQIETSVYLPLVKIVRGEAGSLSEAVANLMAATTSLGNLVEELRKQVERE